MALVEGAGPVGRFGRQSCSTPKVVPGAALPWHRLGRVGGFKVRFFKNTEDGSKKREKGKHISQTNGFSKSGATCSWEVFEVT